jgi:hypothetical protein
MEGTAGNPTDASVPLTTLVHAVRTVSAPIGPKEQITLPNVRNKNTPSPIRKSLRITRRKWHAFKKY